MNNVLVVAEIAQAHDGSLGILHSFIDAVADAGVDVVKFQMHIAEAESSEFEPFRVNFSYEDKTRYDYWQRMSFTESQWAEIKTHCERRDLEFLCSPFSIAAVDMLERLDVKRYKIGAGEVGNLLMLKKIAETGKAILLSSGMSDYDEIDKTIGFLKPFGNPLTLLQCCSKYPTSPEDVGLNVIQEFQKRYRIPIGLSDHSGTVFPALAAVTLGATVVEAHVTFDRRMFGPDASSSLTIDDLKLMVEGVRWLERSLNNPVDKSDNGQFSEMKKIFEKSLAVNKDLEEGDVIQEGDLETKKPAGMGIAPVNYHEIIGKKLRNGKRKNDFMKAEDVIQDQIEQRSDHV